MRLSKWLSISRYPSTSFGNHVLRSIVFSECNINIAKFTAGKEDEIHPDREHDPVLAPEKEEVEPPPQYRVVLLNDDYTPMEFVVDVLRIFFGMNLELATRIMLQVHTEGKGVCGVFPRDIAESKATQVNEYARENQHPLMSDIEIDQ